MKLQIQTISDLITNSSSEVFCVITTEDKTLTTRVFEWLDKCLGFTQDMFTDEGITCRIYPHRIYGEGPDGQVEIDLSCPVDWTQTEFLYDAVDAILKRDFKDEFTKLELKRNEVY